MMPANAGAARILCLVERACIFPVKVMAMHAVGKYSLSNIYKIWAQSLKICNEREGQMHLGCHGFLFFMLPCLIILM